MTERKVGAGGEGRQGRLVLPAPVDFSSAVLDPVTGLRCLESQQPGRPSPGRERVLSCTHSLVTVCHYTYTTQVPHYRLLFIVFSTFLQFQFRPSPATLCQEAYSKICRQGGRLCIPRVLLFLSIFQCSQLLALAAPRPRQIRVEQFLFPTLLQCFT